VAVRIEILGTLRNGVNFNQSQEGLGLPVLKVKDFGSRFSVPDSGLDELDPTRIAVVDDLLLRDGDTVIIRSNGNGELVGRCLFAQRVNRPITFSGFCIRFRPDPGKVNPRYATYLLRSPLSRQQMVAFGSGTGIQNLNQQSIGRIEVDLPSLREQDSIAGLLGSLDDKIELNERANRQIESLASALFRSWFVDFDTVAAKRDGRVPVGVPVDAIDLFPSHFGDSELGPIPQGWRVASLDSVADFLNGLALQRYPSRDGDVLPVIKIAELRAGNSVGADLCGGVPLEYVIDDGDIVFSWSGTLMVDVWCGGKGALNQHLFKVTSRDVPKWFYLAWINEHLTEFQAIAADKATTMGHIRRFHLTEAKVLLPPEPLMKAMTTVQEPLLEQIIHNRLESRTLAGLRNTLVGPLLSGELTVKASEKVVGAAV
jgi:type I restriction enzyme S subunit